MALIRVFARVDKMGNLAIPNNIRQEVGFKPGQLVELKVRAKRSVRISARDNPR